MDNSRQPSLFRLQRVDLDLTFRSRGEAALVRTAYHSRAVARVAGRWGWLMLSSGILTAIFLPIVPGLLAGSGVLVLAVAGLAKVLSLLTAGPARAARTVRILRWLAAPTGAARESADGARVAVRGRIRALRTLTAFDGGAAVFMSVRATRRGRGADLQMAEDFLVDDGSGSTVRVDVEHALFLGRQPLPGAPGSVLPEALYHLVPDSAEPIDWAGGCLLEGDLVEVVGRSEVVVDPSVGDRLARVTPLVRVLRGTADEPLLVRESSR